MKHLNQFITEYIIKKKLDKAIDSEDYYDYFPESKEELTENIEELANKGIYDFNCINTSKITDMSNLFKYIDLYSINYNIKKLNFDVSRWDVSNVKNMTNIFYECANFDCDLSNWIVDNVENMSGMFKNCENFKGKGLENWDVSNVTDMNVMFEYCFNLKNKPSWYKY